ncbi:MAG: hypothetical protein ACRDCE_12520 [Cetobacterium sp.]|uniref:hypothetical protein n=1 Tax=Cetobacterium sp. TaxID=2071632 RepID=UPI003EE65B1E
MPTCPYCNKPIELGSTHLVHMESYHSPINARTLCCSKVVYCVPYLSFNVLESDKQKDDWESDD